MTPIAKAIRGGYMNESRSPGSVLLKSRCGCQNRRTKSQNYLINTITKFNTGFCLLWSRCAMPLSPERDAGSMVGHPLKVRWQFRGDQFREVSPVRIVNATIESCCTGAASRASWMLTPERQSVNFFLWTLAQSTYFERILKLWRQQQRARVALGSKCQLNLHFWYRKRFS